MSHQPPTKHDLEKIIHKVSRWIENRERVNLDASLLREVRAALRTIRDTTPHEGVKTA